MIDIHTHILHGVDDGPDSIEDSIALLRQGVQDGITGAVATSHVLDHLDENTENVLTSRFEELKIKSSQAGLEIDLYLASEMHIQSEFNLASPVITFSGKGKYCLLEFPMSEVPRNAGELFFKLSLEGITPILAHPERNTMILQNPDIILEFLYRGILLQLNAGSVLGRFGSKVKKTAFYFISNNRAHFIASDCHHITGRPMQLFEAFQVISRKFGEKTANLLFNDNPGKAVRGETIHHLPADYESVDKGFAKKLGGFIKKIRQG